MYITYGPGGAESVSQIRLDKPEDADMGPKPAGNGFEVLYDAVCEIKADCTNNVIKPSAEHHRMRSPFRREAVDRAVGSMCRMYAEQDVDDVNGTVILGAACKAADGCFLKARDHTNPGDAAIDKTFPKLAARHKKST